MKNITEYILEGKKFVDVGSIGDFAKWYCFGEMPDGLEGKVTADDVKGLIDNGWFDNFGDEDDSAKKAADFINKNWEKTVRVTSQQTPNDWEISFKFNDETYMATATSYFGDDIDNKWE